MLYATNNRLRVSLPTRLKSLSGKQSIVFPKKAVSFFYALLKQYFHIENLDFMIWAKRTFLNRTFGPFFIVLKTAQYM